MGKAAGSVTRGLLVIDVCGGSGGYLDNINWLQFAR